MGLRLSISALEQKESFIVTDCTGKYSFDNHHGFGQQNNIDYSNISTSTLEIITPKKDLFSIDVTDNFPNEDGIGYEVLPSALSMKEVESGEYNIKLLITGTDKKGSSFTKTAVHKAFFTRSVSCCADKLISRNIGTEDPLKKKEMQELNNLINSMNASIECENFNDAVKIIDLLKEQCACCNCKNQ